MDFKGAGGWRQQFGRETIIKFNSQLFVGGILTVQAFLMGGFILLDRLFIIIAPILFKSRSTVNKKCEIAPSWTPYPGHQLLILQASTPITQTEADCYSNDVAQIVQYV
jgi:hypothetical protein